MKTIKIYLHGENNRDPKLIEVSEDASVNEVIIKYNQEFSTSYKLEDVELFIEDEEGLKQKDEVGEKAGLKMKAHIHCHRCKKIAVVISYNGENKQFHFPPSITAKVILRQGVHAFNISPSDAGDYLLKLDDKTILQPSDHIGSYASFPHCQVILFLTPTKPVQG